MKIQEVKKLSPLEQFLYWIKERHSIYKKKSRGEPKPWTDDEILQNYFFTNPYRENDKVTKWFRKNIRNPLRDKPEVLFATVCFRWFNYIPTGEILKVNNLLVNWDKRQVLKLLGRIRDKGKQIFTGAFMINSPGGEPKLEAICRRINNVWEKQNELLRDWKNINTLEAAHKSLLQFDGMGGFMAYEVVCDLRYTKLLERATDKLTWCNPGPGAIRGMYRLLGREFPKGNNSSSPPISPDWKIQTLKLLDEVRSRLSHMPTFEMREIEHILCESDKYMRLLHGDGRAKRKYNGTND